MGCLSLSSSVAMGIEITPEKRQEIKWILVGSLKTGSLWWISFDYTVFSANPSLILFFSSLILINSREEVVLLAKFGDVFFILYFHSCFRSPLGQYFSNLNVQVNHLRFWWDEDSGSLQLGVWDSAFLSSFGPHYEWTVKISGHTALVLSLWSLEQFRYLVKG